MKIITIAESRKQSALQKGTLFLFYENQNNVDNQQDIVCRTVVSFVIVFNYLTILYSVLLCLFLLLLFMFLPLLETSVYICIFHSILTENVLFAHVLVSVM